MVDVHDQLAGLKLEADGRQASPGSSPPHRRAPDPAEELVVAEQHQAQLDVLGPHRQVRIRDGEAAPDLGVEVELDLSQRSFDACLEEKGLEPLRLLGRQDDLRVLPGQLDQCGGTPDQRLGLAPAEVEAAFGLAHAHPNPLPTVGAEPAAGDQRRPEPCRQLMVRGLRLAEGGRLPLQLAGLRQLTVRFEVDDPRAGGKVVEKRGQVGVEVGRVELHAGEGRPGLQPRQLVLPVGADVTPQPVQLDRPAQPGNRSPAAAGAEHDLTARPHRHPRHRHHGALVAGVEETQALDLVAEELGPNRSAGGRGEDVEDASAHGELAGLLDQRLPGVAELGQSGSHRVEVGPGAGEQLDCCGGQRLRRQRRPHGCPAGGDDQARFGAARQRGEGFQTAAHGGVHGGRPVQEGDRDLGEK